MYAIVDIETTGSYSAANGITEISIHVFDGSAVVEKFETLIPNYEILTSINNSKMRIKLFHFIFAYDN